MSLSLAVVLSNLSYLPQRSNAPSMMAFSSSLHSYRVIVHTVSSKNFVSDTGGRSEREQAAVHTATVRMIPTAAQRIFFLFLKKVKIIASLVAFQSNMV